MKINHTNALWNTGSTFQLVQSPSWRRLARKHGVPWRGANFTNIRHNLNPTDIAIMSPQWKRLEKRFAMAYSSAWGNVVYGNRSKWEQMVALLRDVRI